MQGTALIIRAYEGLPLSTMEFSEPPTLQFLQNAVNGYLEVVPGFDTLARRHFDDEAANSFRRYGDVARCVAFCNEESKLRNLQYNGRATELWQLALRRARPRSTQLFFDYLVGDVVILTGDDEFMAAL